MVGVGDIQNIGDDWQGESSKTRNRVIQPFFPVTARSTAARTTGTFHPTKSLAA
jgi:hypothetical protein